MKSAWMAAVVCLLGSVASAQQGSLAGAVLDPNSALVPGAKITAKHDLTGQESTATAAGNGAYVFPALSVGPYTLTVEHAGFKKLTRSGVTIAVAHRGLLDLKLEIGEVTQSVEVIAETPLLTANTSESGTVFQPKFMRDAPLFVASGFRNPENFINFVPGVNSAFRDQSINGGVRRGKEILIDGASAFNPESGGIAFTTIGSVEQFGEFKLLTGNFSAEYGRSGGGIEVFVTKSGTNDLHGSVFEYVRNDNLDAAGWTNNARNRRRAELRQNEYGFAVGGPVFIPKLYNGKNKSFWYLTTNRYRQNNFAQNALVSIGTERMKQGDFSELGSKLIYNPATTTAGNQSREPFQNNRIPQSQFSAVTSKILPLIPSPSSSGISANLAILNRQEISRNMWSIKGDHAFNDRNRASIWISRQDLKSFSENGLPGALAGGADNVDKPDSYRASHDLTIRPTLLNHAYFGLTRYRNFFKQLPQHLGGWPQKLGLRGVEEGEASSFPIVQFTDGLAQFGNNPKTNGSQLNFQYQLGETLIWVRGRHEWKFGYEYRRGRTFQDPIDVALVHGLFGFTNFQTSSPAARATTGYSFASFLLGGVDNAIRAFYTKGPDILYGYQSGFVQDNIKLTPKLTVNLGLRYELFFPRYDRNFTQSSFDPTIANPAAGNRLGALRFLGEGAGRNGEKRHGAIYKDNFGPRVGAAYQLTSRTVLRGGYGMYFSGANGNTGGGCFPCDFGVNAQTSRASDGLNAVFNWDAGYQPPPGFRPPPVVDPSFANNNNVLILTREDGLPGRIQNWTFNIQHEVPRGWLVDLAYVGSHGSRLNNFTPYNQVDPQNLGLGTLLSRSITDPAVAAAGYRPPYAGFTGTLAQALRPYPQYLNITHTYLGAGGSRYDAFQAKVERRYADFSFLLGYTWSKTLAFRGADTQTGGGVAPADQYNPGLAKTYSSHDIPHWMNIIYTWDLPFGAGKKFLSGTNPFLQRIVSGWTLAGIHQYRSGQLLVLTVPNSLGGGVLFASATRANLTGSPIRTNLGRGDLDPDNPSLRYLNRDAFGVPNPFTFGGAAAYLGDLRNPAFGVENFSIVKRTPVKESVNVEFRADFSNFLNRTDFGVINVNITDPNFGRSQGVMVGPRFIQMALKVNF